MISTVAPKEPISTLVSFPSWVNDDEAGLVMRFIQPGATCVDVGVGRGKTTILMAKAGAARVYAVSNWNDPSQGTLREFLTHAVAAGVRAEIYTLPLSSLDAASLLRHEGITADVILIDADHCERAVWSDYAAWAQVLKPGGVMLFHDVGNLNEPGVERAVSRIPWRVIAQVDTMRAYQKPCYE